MKSIFECIFNLIYEDDEQQRGVFGKLRKYSGDIGAGAVSHLVGKAVGVKDGEGAGHLTRAGIYTAYKAYDVGNNNYQAKNKSMSGSIAGSLLGGGLSELALHGLKKYNNNYNLHSGITI
jgi:hypothetical protein